MSVLSPSKDQRQDEFDQFVINGLNMIHDDKVSKQLLKTMQESPDTVDAIGNAAFAVVKKLSMARKKKVMASTMINGLNVVVGELINIAEAAGANPLNDEQRYQAFSLAYSKVLDDAVRSGDIKPHELLAMKGRIEREERQGQQGQPQAEQAQPQGQPVQPQEPGIMGGMQ